MALVLHARLVTFKWKMIVVCLRAKLALAEDGRSWRRPCRWLAALMGREVASIWGHLGSASQVLRGQRGPSLFK